jgi:3-methyladenine DNA glycosylase AlkD
MKTSPKNSTKLNAVLAHDLSAQLFIKQLMENQSIVEADKNKKFHKDEKPGNKFLGVRMKTIFDTAKAFTKMPLKEVAKLLKSPYYEMRMGAVSIMDFKARAKTITDESKEAIFKLYIDNHDRIDTWDMVDRSAPYVVGGYLHDKSRKILYKLAKSKSMCERRTAIVSTYYFIRQNDVDETFKIAAILVNDKHDLIQKAVGSWIREAGKRDKKQLLEFLENYASFMPRTMLRYAIEKLSASQKTFYMQKEF